MSETEDPPARQDDRTSLRNDIQRLLNRPWMLVVVVLHLGFLGIPLYWKTRYSVGTRIGIIVLSILYTVGAVIFIIAMIRYIIHVLETL